MKAAWLGALLCIAATGIAAAQGYRLDGIDAAAAAMAGSGVALPRGPLEALHLNPALLAGEESWSAEIAAAWRDSTQTVSSRVGPFSGSTAHDGEPELMPSGAWSWRPENGRMVLGVGLLTASHWSLELPQEPANPLLAPQPLGFGAVHARATVTRLPVALAWEVSPRLSLGASVALGRASYAAAPALWSTPDCSGAACFFPAAAETSATGLGFSVGGRVAVLESLALALAWSSGEEYDFAWNTQVANPNLPTFGTGREVELTVEEPSILSVGLAFTPGDRWAVALDARQIAFEGSGELAEALALDDVTQLALGVEWRSGDRLALRAGVAQSDSPVSDPFLVSGIPVNETLVSAGFGWRFGAGAEANVAWQRALDEEVSGPFVSAGGFVIPGTEVTHETGMDTLTVSFSFRGAR